MTEGWEARLSMLRARVQDRVERSNKLVARVQARPRDTQERARARLTRAEQQLNAVVSGLPYRLGNIRRASTVDGPLEAVLDAAGSVYRGCVSISLTSVAHSSSADDGGAETGPTALRYLTSAYRGAAGPLDAAQYALEEGPCIDAVEMDQPAVIFAEDFGDEGVQACWPRFSGVALMLGVGSAVSVAVPWTRGPESSPTPAPFALAAINLYSAVPHAFPEPELSGLVLGAWAAILCGREPAQVHDGLLACANAFRADHGDR